MRDSPEPVAPVEPSRERSSRRLFLTAGAAAVAVAVADAVISPSEVDAAGIVLGGTSSTTRPTTVRNTKASASAKALIGRTTYTGGALNAAGVQGIADGVNASGVWGTANRGTKAAGVYGASTTGLGVYGYGPTGVLGVGADGVVGLSTVNEGSGVLGVASDACRDAVAGVSTSLDGNGLYGEASNGTNAAGVYGTSSTGWAGYFEGSVFVSGSMVFPAAFIQVDHPVNPANQWYRQALVGSYEQVSVLGGNVVTNDAGRATIEVPAIFEQTHRDFRYQLTPIGKATSLHVVRELEGGRFVIEADAPGVRVSWQLTGERTDPSARRHRMDIEAPKVGASRGRYLEPKLFGKPRSRGLRRRGGTLRRAQRRVDDAVVRADE